MTTSSLPRLVELFASAIVLRQARRRSGPYLQESGLAA